MNEDLDLSIFAVWFFKSLSTNETDNLIIGVSTILNLGLWAFFIWFCAKNAKNSKTLNEKFYILGGKIHAKKYFVNFLTILLCQLLIISVTIGGMFYSLMNTDTVNLFVWAAIKDILYSMLFFTFILYLNNMYKRINAITDINWLSIAITFIQIFPPGIIVLFALDEYHYSGLVPSWTIFFGMLYVILWLLLFILPSKNVNTDESLLNCPIKTDKKGEYNVD